MCFSIKFKYSIPIHLLGTQTKNRRLIKLFDARCWPSFTCTFTEVLDALKFVVIFFGSPFFCTDEFHNFIKKIWNNKLKICICISILPLIDTIDVAVMFIFTLLNVHLFLTRVPIIVRNEIISVSSKMLGQKSRKVHLVPTSQATQRVVQKMPELPGHLPRYGRWPCCCYLREWNTFMIRDYNSIHSDQIVVLHIYFIWIPCRFLYPTYARAGVTLSLTFCKTKRAMVV